MVDADTAPWTALGRRQFLRVAASFGLAAPLLGATGPPASAAPQPIERFHNLAIHPRDDWAAGRSATGVLKQEAPGDVRFLLVHHSASSNRYPAGNVPGLIQGFYGAHTRVKGWPDVAYNFFI